MPGNFCRVPDVRCPICDHVMTGRKVYTKIIKRKAVGKDDERVVEYTLEDGRSVGLHKALHFRSLSAPCCRNPKCGVEGPPTVQKHPVFGAENEGA